MESLRPQDLRQVAAGTLLLLAPLVASQGAESAAKRLEIFQKQFTASASPEVRSAALEDLVDCDDPLIAKKIVAKAFEDPEATVYLAGVRLLSRTKDKASIDWLVETAPKCDKPQVRALVLESLSRIGDPRSTGLLTAALEHPSWLVAASAARGLARMKSVQEAPALLKVLDHKDSRVRISAVDALADLKPAEAAAPLQKLLEDDRDWRVKAALCNALVALKATEALGALRRQLQSTQGRLRDDLQRAIRSLEGGGSEDPLANYGLKYHGIGTNSKRITFILDCSESTKAELTFAALKTPLEEGCESTKLGAAKSELIRTLREYQKGGGKFNLIFIHEDFDLWQKTLVDATPDRIKLAIKHVKSQKSFGRTNLGDALAAALSIEDGGATDLKTEALKEAPDTLFILSDGLPPNEGKYKHPEDLLDVVQDINRFARVQIHCIATGHGSFLKSLSGQNHGTYVEKVDF